MLRFRSASSEIAHHVLVAHVSVGATWSNTAFADALLQRKGLRQAALTPGFNRCGITMKHSWDQPGICCLPAPTFQHLQCINKTLLTEVDAVICDIPFGRQYGTIEGCRDSLYKAGFSDVPLCSLA